jgi:penicillin-binding protein 1A
MGIASFIDPVYALCLGTFESNVFEMVSAYATFANEGVFTSPLFVTHIEDRQGNLISSFSSTSQDAVSKQTAYTMITMLKNVITNGTGRRMGWQFGLSNVEIAGKTGTSNENRDAWFMCVTPNLVAGSWVGGEDQQIHLRRRGEGSMMALPIVGDFLVKTYNDPNIDINRDDTFARPALWTEQICDETVEEAELEDEFFE